MKLLELQANPVAFRDFLKIDTDSGVQPLGNCLDDWQRRDFEQLDPGWKVAAGQKVAFKDLKNDREPAEVKGVKTCKLRAFLERPRGHSKSQDLAVMSLWILFAARKRVSGVARARLGV